LNTSSVLAENSIKSQPSQITMVGFRCVLPFVCNNSIELKRTLVLQSLDQNIANKNVIQSFRLITTDLERKDNLAIILAQKVTSSLDASAKLLPQKFLSIPIEFNLDSSSRSGEYTGNIIVEHSQGDLSIPVTVRIKDSFIFTLPVLIFGVLLAFGLAVYQSEGFDRDEIISQMGQLRLRIQNEINALGSDQEVAKIFQAKIESQLVDIETQLDRKNWVEARKGLEEAQSIWSGWSKSQQSWTAIFEYLQQTLESPIGNSIPRDSTYGKEIGFQINQLKRRMADFGNPQEFSEELKPIKTKIQTYLNAKSEHERLNALRMSLGTEGDHWQIPLVNLENVLHQISPDDAEAMQKWQKDLSGLEAKMMQVTELSTTSTRGIDSPIANVFSIQGVPSLVSTMQQGQLQEASWRLKLFRWSGQGIAIAILCGAGFNQLYVSNSTFGANPVADYTSLLAWGFTAEVTRESVTKVLQRFKLPGVSG
jgi:hypothetical protein